MSIKAKLLNNPKWYRLLATALGARRGRQRIATEYIRASAGDRILDIGCGPADILEYFPKVQYVGFDASQRYIDAAQQRWGDRGSFHHGTVTTGTIENNHFDIAIAIGVLHHLTDAEAKELFRLAYSALRHGGRLVTVDGAYVEGQPWLVRLMLSQDRGKYVRQTVEYENLAHTAFHDVKPHVISDLITPVPYTHFVMECFKAP